MTSEGGIRKDRKQFLEYPLDKNWRFRAYLEKGDFVINIEYSYQGKTESILRFDQSGHEQFHCDYLNKKLKEFSDIESIENKIETAFDFIKNDLNYIINYGNNKLHLSQNVLQTIKDELMNEIVNPQYGKQTCSHSISANSCIRINQKFKETEIGKIPEEWEIVTLSSLSSFEYGKMPKKEDYVENGFPIFSGYRIVGYHKKYLYDEPQLIVVARGVGGTGDVKISPPRSFITNLSIVLRINHEKVNKEYLKYYFYKGLRHLDSGSAQSQITINDLRKICICLPSLIEQHAIAKILSDFDVKIELNRQMNSTLEGIAEALFKRWFVDFEFPNEQGKPYKSSGGKMVESELGELPEEWNVGIISDLCDFINNGGTPKRMENRYWENGTTPWYKTGELNDGVLLDSEEHITEEGLKESACQLWPSNTILIALYASPTVGRLGLISRSATSNQACSGLKAKDSVGYAYLFYTLFFKRTEFNSVAVGSAQQNISQQIVKNAKTIIPSDAILSKFQKTVSLFFERRALIEQENFQLSSLRDSLLPKLMSGEIRVQTEVS